MSFTTGNNLTANSNFTLGTNFTLGGLSLSVSSVTLSAVLSSPTVTLTIPARYSATLDFGLGSNTTTTFISNSTVNPSMKVDTFVLADAVTGTHTANDHKYFPCLASVSGQIVGTSGIQLTAVSEHVLTGQFLVRAVWSN